ncbi:MAG: enoyl-CoA hydratase/isomerase family protein [bacterium]|nr:enoyl-CoA hydratase/isomerase family protein [bacterium]MCP4968319.1 enoyl-CoA hydratase/isomerase family protein [bacterium]
MSLVDYAVSGAVAQITLNRPPVNALDSELIADIDAAITQAEDPAIRAVVINGTKHFAAGADITRFVDAFDSEDSEPQASGLGAVIFRLEGLQKPTIAAISGYALGGGLELAMGADFRYLADDAKVGQPEILLGIIPGAGGTQRLARIIGFQKAKALIFSGRHIGADEAEVLGLADKVVAPEALLETALADAAQFTMGPTRAYWAVKKAMGAGYGLSIESALGVEREAFEEVFATDDAKTGILAFVNKEKPDFSGK